MRKLIVVLIAVIVCSVAGAQVRVSLNLNVDRQPIWGPTGYDHAEYYYFPDLEVYYNVPLQRFYYYNGARWASSSSLPSRYRGHDLYNSYKVVINERAPYRNHQLYREKYQSFKGRHDQEPIRDSRDERYYANRNHPEHDHWVQQQKHNRGNDNRRGNDNGRGNKHEKK
jgi:hypothetical protein